MTIRINPGYPVITPDDLQWSHRGRAMGVELTEFGNDPGLRFVAVFEKSGTDYSSLVGSIFQKCQDSDIAAAGGPMGWIKDVFIPWLNGLLLEAYPPLNQDVTTLTPFQQVDALLAKSVVLVPQPDGTLKAMMK